MPQSLDDAQEYSERLARILIHKPQVTEDEGKQIIEEAKANFAEHFNKGWLEYRKSVTEAGDWAATEWTGAGRRLPGCARARVHRLPGRLRDDEPRLGAPGCRGGGAGTAPADAHAHPGADRPAARRAGAADGPDHSGRHLQYSFFCASGTESIEGAIKLAKMYHAQTSVHRRPEGFPRQDDGLAQHAGQGRLPRARRASSTAARSTMSPSVMRTPSSGSWNTASRSASAWPAC